MINIAIIVLFLLLPVQVHAFTIDTLGIRAHINGYLGYKYIASTAKNSAIPSQPELGINLSVELNDHWSTYTQFQYDDNIENAMAYNFISYKTALSEDAELSINAGKLRHRYGLYNSARVNPLTRQGVVMPQAIYWDSLRDILTSGTGVEFNIEWKNLEISYSITDPAVTDPDYDAKIWSPRLLKTVDTSFGSFQLATLQYTFDTIPLVYKGSWTRINLGSQNTPAVKFLFPQYENSEQITTIWTNSLKYVHNDWTFSAESILVQPFFAEKTSQLGLGLSFTAQYELTEHTALMVNYNEYRSGKPRASAQPWYNYAKDINIGVTYHRDKWLVGAQIHRINGGRWVDNNDWNADPNSYKEWWMVGINAVYFF
jgi:hypothetical protein